MLWTHRMIRVSGALLLVITLVLPLVAQGSMRCSLRFYEGTRTENTSRPATASSFTLTPFPENKVVFRRPEGEEKADQ